MRTPPARHPPSCLTTVESSFRPASEVPSAGRDLRGMLESSALQLAALLASPSACVGEAWRPSGKLRPIPPPPPLLPARPRPRPWGWPHMVPPRDKVSWNPGAVAMALFRGPEALVAWRRPPGPRGPRFPTRGSTARWACPGRRVQGVTPPLPLHQPQLHLPWRKRGRWLGLFGSCCSRGCTRSLARGATPSQGGGSCWLLCGQPLPLQAAAVL